MTAPSPLTATPEATTQRIGGLTVRHLIPGEGTGHVFTLLEHLLTPGALGSPTHTHTHEDEYSYVLEGTLTVEVGSQVHTAGPGEVVFKPRGLPHAFLNAGDRPVRFLELVAPATFETYFARLEPLVPSHTAPDVPGMIALAASYGVSMHIEDLPRLVRQYGLHTPAL